MAVLGLALILLATSGLGWPVALGWAVVAAACAGIEFRARTKRTRVFVPLLAILCLPIMTFEGGFLMSRRRLRFLRRRLSRPSLARTEAQLVIRSIRLRLERRSPTRASDRAPSRVDPYTDRPCCD
jgi:hypothetical protein